MKPNTPHRQLRAAYKLMVEKGYEVFGETYCAEAYEELPLRKGENEVFFFYFQEDRSITMAHNFEKGTYAFTHLYWVYNEATLRGGYV